jgi:BirA family transcriptional regulator, biotin operon repressor / biotin---[acetyl-CoA-carboxylase] ligase
MRKGSGARRANAPAALGVGLPRAHYRLTDSTNERAKELALAGAPHGTVVTADEQTAGRGRQGRQWTAPPRTSVLMSVLLRNLEERHALLPLAAALAVLETCECEGGVGSREAAIKWPNDVWLDGRKVAGILIEGRPQEGWAVLGIGLNVNIWPEDFPAELRESATSIAIEAKGERDLEFITEGLIQTLGTSIELPDREILDAWREHDALRGKAVRWAGGKGVARGIDDQGALIVDTSGGRITLDAGEVHLHKD